MKLAVINENYPHQDNIPGDMFVHVRIKDYQKSHGVKVFAAGNSNREIVYEGVDISFYEDHEKLYQNIKLYNPDRIIIHFYQSWMLDSFINKLDIKTLIWVHGYEALGWYRRLFNYSWYAPPLYRYIIKNTRQQYYFRKLISYANKGKKVSFVFVSQWMKRITEVDTLLHIKNEAIIPNPIDTIRFKYVYKEPWKRKKILIIRSFNSNKYANDISVKAIELLSKESFFNELEIKIIGDGSLFDKLLAPIKHLPNISFQKGFLTPDEIPTIQSEYGIFLCPTRQDAQGVSMCEAMSSGLVPITSFSTAIPEFVDHLNSGILTHNPKEIAEAIILLYNNPSLFEKLSHNASITIKNQCDMKLITDNELKFIKN